MWIIPSNHPLHSQFATELVASKEDLCEISDQLSQSLTWRSKLCSHATWQHRWNRVFWIPVLFSRILKPSQNSHHTFAEKYTESLPDIHALGKVKRASEISGKIQDSFGRTLEEQSTQLTLFGSGSKMWKHIFQERIQLYKGAYDRWVSQLRSAYTQRSKLALHIFEKGCLSLESTWKSPIASDGEGGSMKQLNGNGKYKLRDQVLWNTIKNSDGRRGFSQSETKRKSPSLHVQTEQENWPTPAVEMRDGDMKKFRERQKRLKERHGNRTGNGAGLNLHFATQLWPTTQSRDWKPGKTSITTMKKNVRPLNEVVLYPTIGADDHRGRSTTGKVLQGTLLALL